MARHSLQSGCGVCAPPGGESGVRGGPEPGIPTLSGHAGLSADRPAPPPQASASLLRCVPAKGNRESILSGSSFPEIWLASISSHPGGCLYILLAVSLGAQKFGAVLCSIFALLRMLLVSLGKASTWRGHLGVPCLSSDLA